MPRFIYVVGLIFVGLFIGCTKESIEPINDNIIKGAWKINTTGKHYRVKELNFKNQTYTEVYKKGKSEPFNYKVKQIGKDSYLVRYNKYSNTWQTICRFEIRHVIYLYLYYPNRTEPIIFQRK